VPNTHVYALAASDGGFSSVVEQLVATVDTRGLAPGRHTLFVESQDSSGAWGPPTALFFTVQQPVRAVGVSPGDSGTQGAQGQLITYTLSVTNQGSVPDSFRVSASASWPVWTFTSVGPLAVGESASFQVTVRVPENASDWSSDTAQVRVTSVGDPQKEARASIVTMAVRSDLPPLSIAAEDPTW